MKKNRPAKALSFSKIAKNQAQGDLGLPPFECVKLAKQISLIDRIDENARKTAGRRPLCGTRRGLHRPQSAHGFLSASGAAERRAEPCRRNFPTFSLPLQSENKLLRA